VLAVLLWFVPPVYMLLWGGPITVTRWTKKEGQVEAVVGPGEKGWAELDKISKHAIYAVIAAEDGKFYEHSGFDFASIKHAYETNKKRGKYVRGGSTITQQTVKMAFLGREKTLIRKAREAVGTVLIELLLTKDEILEWYLNLAEFGDGVYGIHKGAQHYFKTRPELLTVEQAVHLALVLPSPNLWSRGLRSRRLSDFGHRRFASIANNMKASGHISKTQWTTTMRFGDFGRPIAGFQAMIAAETKGEMLCPGDPSCPDDASAEAEAEEAQADEIVAGPEPQPAAAPPPPPAPSSSVIINSSRGAVGADKNSSATSVSEAAPVAPPPSTATSAEETQPVAAPPPPAPASAPASDETDDDNDDDDPDF
jgi:monofunctional biosynthetic peptidoglycan transglycosylase